MHHVHYEGVHVASINKQHLAAEGHRKEEPWLLLYVMTGRIERFASYRAAREEACKTWPWPKFVRQ